MFKTNVFFLFFVSEGISYQDSPEFFDWFNDYRAEMCEETVTTEIIPLWAKQPGLLEKLGERVSELKLKYKKKMF